MMLETFNTIPLWVHQLLWSVLTLLLINLIGRILGRMVCRRLSQRAASTQWRWDDAMTAALGRGIPIWTLLFGIYVATGFWSLSPDALSTVARLLQVTMWASITSIGIGLAGQLVVAYSSQFPQTIPVTSLTQNIAKIIIAVLGSLMILNSLGISVTPLLTALGVGGLAVALALQDTLSNLFSGFYLTMARDIRIGDYVKLESGQEGYVEDIGWRATKIRMLPNNMVLIPNKKLGEAVLTNYYLPSRELAVLVEVGVDYGSDLERVERVTIEVAREIMRTAAGGVPSFEPFIRYHTFAAYSINFTVILRAKEFVDQYLIKHEFIKRLQARYRAEGITIPFPTKTVLTKDVE